MFDLHRRLTNRFGFTMLLAVMLVVSSGLDYMAFAGFSGGGGRGGGGFSSGGGGRSFSSGSSSSGSGSSGFRSTSSTAAKTTYTSSPSTSSTPSTTTASSSKPATSSTPAVTSSTGFFSSKATTAPATALSDKKGFGGTSMFDAKKAQDIKIAKAAEAKQAYTAETNQFKKTAPVYTPATMPSSIQNNPIVRNTPVKSTYTYSSYRDDRDRYYSGIGWHAPPYVYQTSPSFGAFDAMMLWMVLDTIDDSKRDSAKFAYNQSNNADFQAWHKEAVEMAKTNTELKTKLDAMDKKLATMSGPKDEKYVPAGMPATIAVPYAVLEASTNKEQVEFKMASGMPDGVYDQAGKLVKNGTQKISATNQNTAGTVENIKLFLKGDVDGFIGQNDAITMFSFTDDDAAKRLSAHTTTMYKEAVVIVVRRDSGIKSITDIGKGNIVFTGPKDSGQEYTWKNFVRINPENYAQAKTKSGTTAEGIDAVIDNPKAVVIATTGLNAKFLKALEARASKDNLRLVKIDDKKIIEAKCHKGLNIYTPVTISSKAFPNLQKGFFFAKDLDTVAVDATFVISDAWKNKNGNEAFEELNLTVQSIQSTLEKATNGFLE